MRAIDYFDKQSEALPEQEILDHCKIKLGGVKSPKQ
jgi:hypothetical protein